MDTSASTPGALAFDVHDPAGYDMTPCGAGDSSPYQYGLGGGGAATRRPECSELGDVTDRWVELWSDGGEPIDVREACGGFDACEDPFVPVLAHDQDELAEAVLEPASGVARSALPRLVLCAAACCSQRSACGDAGWSP